MKSNFTNARPATSATRRRAKEHTEVTYRTRALERGLALLSCFSIHKPENTLAELADATDLDKATALRLLRGLETMRFVQSSGEDGRYRLGLKVVELAAAYLGTQYLVEITEPLMQQLARTCDQTSEVGILDGADTVILAVVYPARPLRHHVVLGQRDPAYCTSLGKVLLADLDQPARDRILARANLAALTPNTITDVARLKEHLALVRERGYAFDDQETIPGLRCVAAPIRDSAGRTVASINVSGPAAEFDGEHLETFIAHVKAAAAEASARLGYSGAA